MEEAGFVKGTDGRLRKDGKPFEFTILCNQGNEVRIHCAELIQQRLASLGITVKIRVIEWASFVNQYIDKRNYEAVILGWTISQDPDIFDIWHSSKQKPKELNFMGFENKEVDDLLVRARRTFDQEERRRCYWKHSGAFGRGTALHLPLHPLCDARGAEAGQGDRTGTGRSFGYNFRKWYVPEGQQRYRTTNNARLHP